MKETRKLYSLAAVIVIIVACTGSTDTPDNITRTGDTDAGSVDTLTAQDTIEIEVDPNRPKIDVAKLISKSNKIFDLPLTIDSAFVSAYTKEYDEELDYNLTMQEAKYLQFDFVQDNKTGNSSYDVTRFIFMDSLMREGEEAYEEYQSSLDLGMTRYSIASVIGKIELSEVSFLMLWFTDYATYEACPWGAGTCVYATLFTKGVATNTILVGEESSGGDPPVWGETRISSEITAKSILIKRVDRFGDEDYDTGEEIIEVTKKESDISITPYGMVVIENRGGE